jgi:hypothetical protein
MRGLTLKKRASSSGLDHATSSTYTVQTPSTPSWKKKTGKKLQKKIEVWKKDGVAYSMEEPAQEKRDEICAAVQAAFDLLRAEHMADEPEIKELPKSHWDSEDRPSRELKPRFLAAVVCTQNEFSVEVEVDNPNIKEPPMTLAQAETDGASGESTPDTHTAAEDTYDELMLCLVDSRDTLKPLQAEKDAPSVEQMTNSSAAVYGTHDKEPIESLPDQSLNVQTLKRYFEQKEDTQDHRSADCADNYEEELKLKRGSVMAMANNGSM